MLRAAAVPLACLRPADILVGVNPFKATVHFTPTEMREYCNRGDSIMEPHPYIIVDDAYRAMMELTPGGGHQAQSILISGESGAGKTYTVRKCMEYLSDVAESPNGTHLKVMDCNPVLEAFGNAKTSRNDNSSRFGPCRAHEREAVRARGRQDGRRAGSTRQRTAQHKPLRRAA